MFKMIDYNKTLAFAAGVLFFLSAPGKASTQDISIAHDLIERKVTLFSTDGKLFENPYVNVAGSPFFLETWKYGIIEINDKDIFGNVQLRLNLQDQQVHYRKPDGTELVIKAGAVKKITLFDSSGKLPALYFFQCGFPSVDHQNTNNFYQVLSDGDIKFLKAQRKSIHEEKDPLSGEIRKEFRLYEDYYFFLGGNMERIKKDKTYLLGKMHDREKMVENFVIENKLSYKSIDDIKKMVDYYNGLE
jgi:hypothetical protein